MQRPEVQRRVSLGFTIVEMLVAVAVLVVVVLATARIFSASSRVASIAEANADLIQTAAVIEQQLRDDLASIPTNNFLVIQQVEVANASNPVAGAAADPSLAGREIRADQLAFFAQGARTTTRYIGSQESGSLAEWTPESAVARVYYGHGVLGSTLPVGIDPLTYDGEDTSIVPWRSGRVETVRWNDGATQAVGLIPPVRASQWPLVRLATLLATDGRPTTTDAGGNPTSTTFPVFASNGVNASVSLFASRRVRLGALTTAYPNTYAPLWNTGRVDIVKWQTDDLFSQMAYQPTATTGASALPFISSNLNNPWSQPSSRLRMIQTLSNWAVATTSQTGAGATELYVTYPRVERAALGPSRVEQMLTAPVIAGYCSSFKVEWTWAEGVGRTYSFAELGRAPEPSDQLGIVVFRGASQPWFGMDNPVSLAPSLLSSTGATGWGGIGLPLVVGAPANSSIVCSVEGPRAQSGSGPPVWLTDAKQGSKRVYHAVFGFNQSDPTALNPSLGDRGPYTPLPSALRFTIRLHDSLGRIEGGREFQFIIDLPKR
jgi:type II secretory pathway pseudopilin PulG